MVTGGMIFSSKCTKKCLAAGLRPDLLGSLSAPPDPLAAIRGSAVRRQWVVELLFVYQTSVFTLYTTPLYCSTTITLFYYYSALSCSYTTQSFIQFANINAKWKLIYNISSCHTLIRWKTQTNLYLNVYVLSGTILQVLLLRRGKGSGREGKVKEEGEEGEGKGRKKVRERRWDGGKRREGKERTVPIVPVLRKHHWYGAIMGPIQTLCTRALTELATPLELNASKFVHWLFGCTSPLNKLYVMLSEKQHVCTVTG